MIIITDKSLQTISIPKGRLAQIERSGPSSSGYSKQEIDEMLGKKQDTLISGVTIKTINGESILGSGNIQIDLSDYYTKEETDQLINGIEVPTKTSELLNDSDFVNGTQLSEVESKIPSLNGYATESWVSQQGFAKEADIPTDYATLSDITDAINDQEFKTVNGETIVGQGDIEIKCGRAQFVLTPNTEMTGWVGDDQYNNLIQYAKDGGDELGCEIYANIDGSYIPASSVKMAKMGMMVGFNLVFNIGTTILKSNFFEGGQSPFVIGGITEESVNDQIDVKLQGYATETYVNNLVGDIESALAAIIG